MCTSQLDSITFCYNRIVSLLWRNSNKKRSQHITFTCPNGRRCRDSSLHDEAFLKENLEALFAYRQAVGFRHGSVEPDEGWMDELVDGLVRLGKEMERGGDVPMLTAPPTWTDSKQRRREALKKLAMGQKLGGEYKFEQTM